MAESVIKKNPITMLQTGTMDVGIGDNQLKSVDFPITFNPQFPKTPTVLLTFINTYGAKYGSTTLSVRNVTTSGAIISQNKNTVEYVYGNAQWVAFC